MDDTVTRPKQSVQCDYFGHEINWLDCEADSVIHFLQGNKQSVGENTEK